MNIKAKVVLCRQAARDQEIAGYRIQKDQWIGCAVYAMHRDPKYWQVRTKGSLLHRLCLWDPHDELVSPCRLSSCSLSGALDTCSGALAMAATSCMPMHVRQGIFCLSAMLK